MRRGYVVIIVLVLSSLACGFDQPCHIRLHHGHTPTATACQHTPVPVDHVALPDPPRKNRPRPPTPPLCSMRSCPMRST